jgi:hypothetical protein
MADINNDGWLDIFTTEMLPETDYRLKTTIKFDEYDIVNAKNNSIIITSSPAIACN